jgi:O-antigen ligase
VALEGGSALPFRALVAFTLVLLLAPQTLVPALAPLRPALLAAAAAVGAYVVDRLSRGRPLSIVNRELWIAGALAAWALALVPLSLWPGGSLGVLLEMYVKSLAIFWLLANVVNTPARLHRLAWGLSLMAVPIALTGVRHFLAGTVYRTGDGTERILGYEAPLTTNPNDLALMLNLLLPIAVALLLTRPRPLARVVLIGVIATSVLAVVMTFSRGGFLTLGVIGLVYLWKLRSRREGRWAVLALALSVGAAPFLPAGYLERLATITDTQADTTGSSRARWEDTIAAASYIADHPLAGAGLGQNILALNEERGARWREIHNVYLQYGVELGLPGLALFVALLGGCIGAARAAGRPGAGAALPRVIPSLAEGIEVSLIAFAAAGLFHPVAYHFYFYYVAGLALAARNIRERVEAGADVGGAAALPVPAWRAP